MAGKANKKKTLDEILALIPDTKDVVFDPLPLPNRRKAELRIPEGVDCTDPYALFLLFWPEQLWGIISRHTNLYAAHQRTKDTSVHKRPWWDTSAAEERASQTAWGCSLCKVALCRQGTFWELFHSSRTS